jgi:hypothetical protein
MFHWKQNNNNSDIIIQYSLLIQILIIFAWLQKSHTGLMIKDFENKK